MQFCVPFFFAERTWLNWLYNILFVSVSLLMSFVYFFNFICLSQIFEALFLNYGITEYIKDFEVYDTHRKTALEKNYTKFYSN